MFNIQYIYTQIDDIYYLNICMYTNLTMGMSCMLYTLISLHITYCSILLTCMATAYNITFKFSMYTLTIIPYIQGFMYIIIIYCLIADI